MSTFESEIKTTATSEADLYELISDLSNIERYKDKIPTDKVKDVTFDRDSCTFTVEPLGQLGLRIVDRIPDKKTIKFAADRSPIDFNLWVQLKEVAQNDTRIKVTVKTELNPMIKMMVEKPIKMFVEKLADGLSKISINKNA